MKRPEFIKHYSETQEPAAAYYSESDEKFSIGSPFAKVFGLKKLGIHHEVLEPGRRTSFPHAEEDEEEFVFVIEGTPQAWIDGELYDLSPGDGVGFPCGTGISHTFINNSESNVRLLVVGEASKPKSKIYYPLNESRKDRIQDRWWSEAPKRSLGPHNGLPNSRKV